VTVLRPRSAGLLLLVLLAGAACSSTVYDAAGVPRLGALVCADPGTHACTALDFCAPDDDVEHCESDCHACTTDVAGATPICVANRCEYQCPAGLLRCTAGCCAAAAIAAGGDNTCAIAKGTGELLCWGANNDGQLGIGDPSGADQPHPVVVPLPGPVRVAAVGAAHSCAILDDAAGSVYCWGRRSSFLSGVEYEYYPIAVPAFDGATAIATGGGHTAAILANGAIRGGGSWNPDAIPADRFPANATQIATGNDFTCVIAAGSVVCWGANDHGQLGASTAPQASPLTVDLPGPVSTVALGVDHACASVSDGTVRCWSAMHVGLTTSPVADPAAPYALDAVTYPVVALSAGSSRTSAGDPAGFTCAVRGAPVEGVECWGTDAVPPVVIGGTPDRPGTPVHVSVPGVPSAIASGGSHNCAIDGGGAVVCWGKGDRGQLGDGLKLDSAIPVGIVSR
jgi:hypothetical protein